MSAQIARNAAFIGLCLFLTVPGTHGEGASGYEDALTGAWNGARQKLTQAGMAPFFTATGELFSVVSGGNETGERFLSILDYGLDFDLDQLLGVSGGSIHLHFQTLKSNSPSELAGDFGALSNIDGYNSTRLYQLSFQKDWESGFSFRTGLIDIDDDFMNADYNALFINSNFGPMPVQSANNPAPIWPIGAPGIWLSFAPPEDNWFVQFGVYDGNLGEEEENSDGLEIRMNRDEGLLYIAEGGIETDLVGRPVTFKVGAFYHSGREFDDFESGGQASGNSAFYFVAKAEVTSQLGLFIRVGHSPDEEKNTVSWYGDVGLSYVGLLPGREDDVFGFGVTYTDFSDDYLDATPGVSHSETVLEWTYQAAVTKWLSVQPDMQWILDPHEGESDAFVVGVRAEVLF